MHSPVIKPLCKGECDYKRLLSFYLHQVVFDSLAEHDTAARWLAVLYSLQNLFRIETGQIGKLRGAKTNKN